MADVMTENTANTSGSTVPFDALTRVLQFALATRWNHSKIWPYACSVVLKSFRLVARSRLKILNLSMNGQSCCGPRL